MRPAVTVAAFAIAALITCAAEAGKPKTYTVKPGDSDAVLMRWKLDDKQMRVVYGDLRTETVALDEQTSDSP